MPSKTVTSRSDRILPVFFGALGVVAWWELTRSWHASILDRYEFRQLQTALSTYWMIHAGWHLNYLTPLFGPPWSIPMEFPTYQMCVAWVVEVTGLGLEPAGRLVGILFFAGTLPAVYDLLAIAQLPPRRRLIVLCFVITTPVYLFYARTFMIETAAVFLAVWFLAFLRRALVAGSLRWTAAATAAGVLAALTKITTFAVFCPPAAALFFCQWFGQPRNGVSRPRTLFVAAVPVVAALAVGWWWVLHADFVKHSNPFSGFLTSTDLQAWNYGTFGLRFEAGFWRHLQETVFQFVLCEGAFVIALVAATLARPAARFCAVACLAGFFAGPLVFSNLYHVHDYYYSANGLLLVVAAGVLLASAWDDDRVPRAFFWTALVAVAALQLLSFDRGYGTYHWRPAPPPPEMGAIIQAGVPVDGVILIYGADWNPLLPYYAERRAVMVPGERENETAVLEQILARLPPRKIAAMITVGTKFRARPDFIAGRTTRFGLAGKPFAQEGDTDLYLSTAIEVSAAATLSSRRLQSAKLLVAPAPATTSDLHAQDISGLAMPMMHPHAIAARTRYGISAATVEGRAVINAHAPSELVFDPPAGAHTVEATFGLPAGAYDHSNPAVTDGIEVEIFEERADGLRELLNHRVIDPANVAADRGPQVIRASSAQPFAGRIVLAIGPGPNGNTTNDWAYWSGVDIH